MVVEERLTAVSPTKKPGRVALTTLEVAVLLLLARAYTVPVPREIVKVELVCQLSGVLSPTSQAYSKVPPLPLADRLTVAVVFADAGLLNVTLEAVGAPTARVTVKVNVVSTKVDPSPPVLVGLLTKNLYVEELPAEGRELEKDMFCGCVLLATTAVAKLVD